MNQPERMNQPGRRNRVALPWAGLVSLVAAAALATWLLSPAAPPLALLQTWYLGRAAGLVALALLWLSVTLGLMQSSGLLGGLTGPAANVDVHAFAALLSLYATTFHAWILLWDRFVTFEWTELALPFTAAYEPVLLGLGTLAFYGALGAVVTTYLRGWMGPRAWRLLHQASLIALVFGLVHGYLLGPDTTLAAVRFFYYFAGWSTGLLLAYRVAGGIVRRARNAG